jgi:hypothetical protein
MRKFGTWKGFLFFVFLKTSMGRAEMGAMFFFSLFLVLGLREA